MTESNRNAVVTGAARGMGYEITSRLVSLGWHVAALDINATAVAEAAAKIGPNVVPVAVDISDFDAVQKAIDGVRTQIGPLQAIVNNAGLWVTKPFVDTNPDIWMPDFKVNLYGTLNCTRAVIGDMVQARWGRVVNIISDAGRVGVANQSTYSAAKAAVAGFARALAKEVGPAGVTVNCISMGPTLTPATDSFLQGDALAKREKATPLRRLGQPTDTAGAVAFLISDDASWITGQTLSVNGGMNMLP